MTYKLYPRPDGGFLAKDFELENPARIVFAIDDSDVGDEFCLKLEEPEIYDAIRALSQHHQGKSDASALARFQPELEGVLGDSLKLAQAIGILGSSTGVWLYLS
ncbi:hypothetical protein WAE61_02100 [Comamonadaceae bacterium PP-2]